MIGDKNQCGQTPLIIKTEVPSGVTLFQGQAAAQGGLVGGESQVLFPKNVSIPRLGKVMINNCNWEEIEDFQSYSKFNKLIELI